MSSFQGLMYGLSVALTPENMLAALFGALIGTLVGVLPGIGPLGAMALLLTTTLTMQPESALIMLAGIYYGSQYGGSTTSILVNIPGEAASIVTCIDGYQMAKKGRAGAALAVSAVGSFVAGTLGMLALTLFAPLLSTLALSFGPPEYFALCLLGLLTLSRVSGGSLWKGLMILGIGLAIATVGMEPVTGTSRFTFDNIQLRQGIGLIPVTMGLFGIAEVLLVAEQKGGMPQVTAVRFRELWPSLTEWGRAFPAMLRASVLGFAFGLLPGPTPVLATFASYNLERRLSKHPEEFGHGAIEAVAGPETANNAGTSGRMVPVLSLGIPFSPGSAMLLAGLMVHGVQPGPLMMSERPDVFWGVVASMWIGNLALLILNLPLVGMWVSFLRIKQSILLALILMFTLIGTYTLNNSLLDLGVALAFGVLGYVLRKLDFDVAPLILALVVGPILENTFRQSLYISRGDPMVFLQRPISGILISIAVATMVLPSVWRLVSGRRTKVISVDAASYDD